MMAAPSEAIWNDKTKEAWTRAYASAVDAPADYKIDDITGKLPETLRGTVFRNGPGNFERGGERYAHVLDGDAFDALERHALADARAWPPREGAAPRES